MLLLHFQDRPELGLVELAVDAVPGQQLLVAALLGNHAALDHQDPVRLQDRGQAVGDDDAGSSCHELLQGVLDCVLRNGIQGGGRLVQNQNPRVLQDDPGD